MYSLASQTCLFQASVITTAELHYSNPHYSKICVIAKSTLACSSYNVKKKKKQELILQGTGNFGGSVHVIKARCCCMSNMVL